MNTIDTCFLWKDSILGYNYVNIAIVICQYRFYDFIFL